MSTRRGSPCRHASPSSDSAAASPWRFLRAYPALGLDSRFAQNRALRRKSRRAIIKQTRSLACYFEQIVRWPLIGVPPSSPFEFQLPRPDPSAFWNVSRFDPVRVRILLAQPVSHCFRQFERAGAVRRKMVRFPGFARSRSSPGW